MGTAAATAVTTVNSGAKHLKELGSGFLESGQAERKQKDTTGREADMVRALLKQPQTAPEPQCLR